jgi:hypothetical protein
MHSAGPLIRATGDQVRADAFESEWGPGRREILPTFVLTAPIEK